MAASWQKTADAAKLHKRPNYSLHADYCVLHLRMVWQIVAAEKYAAAVADKPEVGGYTEAQAAEKAVGLEHASVVADLADAVDLIVVVK